MAALCVAAQPLNRSNTARLRWLPDPPLAGLDMPVAEMAYWAGCGLAAMLPAVEPKHQLVSDRRFGVQPRLLVGELRQGC